MEVRVGNYPFYVSRFAFLCSNRTILAVRVESRTTFFKYRFNTNLKSCLRHYRSKPLVVSEVFSISSLVLTISAI